VKWISSLNTKFTCILYTPYAHNQKAYFEMFLGFHLGGIFHLCWYPNNIEYGKILNNKFVLTRSAQPVYFYSFFIEVITTKLDYLGNFLFNVCLSHQTVTSMKMKGISSLFISILQASRPEKFWS
jgi:hypothetical protein